MSGSIITMAQFVELVKALVWPSVLLMIIFSFRAQFKELFARSSGLNVDLFGFKVALTVKQVHDAAQELFKEISNGLLGLTQKQKELFEAVRTADGIKTVDQITREVFGTPFVRAGAGPGEAKEHEEFRTLRDSQLIRPKEGGRWKLDKHPVVTPYAQIIFRAAPDILTTAKS